MWGGHGFLLSKKQVWGGKNLHATSSSVTSPQAPDQAEMIQSLIKVHCVHEEILKSLGVDPCKEYEQSRVENVLARILPGVKKCSLCTREFHNT